MPPSTGRVIAGRYNLQHPIGRGAMGVVWRARDQLLDREVAVKEVVISALIGADERRNAYQRTLREARTAARLSHRGVVIVYDVVEEDSRPWIVMELVPSQSLDQVLTSEGRLPTARAGRIGQQLLSALAAAHAAGVLHRDVKPSNVLISATRTGDGWDERAVLTDFGIAQFEGDPRLTQTGMVMGSPGFTAPERIRGGDATPGSDLWSLGATIYAAVEGRGPYEQRGGAITTMSAIINEDAPIAPHAGRLAPLIAALLRRDPSTRPSASAAARMFTQVLPQLAQVTDEPPPAPHPATVFSAYGPKSAAPAAAPSATTPEDPRANKVPAAVSRPRTSAEQAGPDLAGAEQAGTEKTSAEQVSPAEAGPAKADADQAVAASKDRARADKPAAGQSVADKAAASVADEAAAAKPVPAVPAQAAPAGADSSVADELAVEDGADAAGETPGEDADSAESQSGADAESRAAAEAAAESGSAPETAAESAEAAEPESTEPESTEAQRATAESADTVDGAAGAAEPAAGEAAAGEAAAAAALLAVDPADEDAPSGAGDTVIASNGSPGHEPTQLSIPAARLSSAAPAPLKSAQPTPVLPKPAQPERAQPKPSFTAAKPAVPTFSAANPLRLGRPVIPPPDNRPDNRPAYGPPGGTGQGYPAGGTTPFPPPPDGQYAGPSRSYPDLAGQYAPGTAGRRDRAAGRRGQRGRGRGRGRIVWLVVAVLVVVAAGVGAALALHGNGGGPPSASGPAVVDTVTSFQSVNALNNPSTAHPNGWWPAQLAAGDLGSTAGFSLELPPGWSEQRAGLATDFTGPGGMLVEVDLTAQSTSNMVAAAQGIEHTQVAVNHKFPGYKRVNLQSVPVRNTHGAFWKFTWTPAGKTEQVADDILFEKQTPAGLQDYAIYIRSPESTFKTALTQFDQILQTFQTVPATQTLPPSPAS